MTDLKAPRPGNRAELADYQRTLVFLVDTGRMYLGEGWDRLNAAIAAEAQAGGVLKTVGEVRVALNWVGGVCHPVAAGEPYSVASGLSALRASWYRDPKEHPEFLSASIVKRTRRLFRERYGQGDETSLKELKETARAALEKGAPTRVGTLNWHEGTRVAFQDALNEAFNRPRSLQWTIRERWLKGPKRRKIPSTYLETQLNLIGGARTPGGSLDRAALAQIPDLDSDLVACALEDAPEVHGATDPLGYASGAEWKQPQGFTPAAIPAPYRQGLGFLEKDWQEFAELIGAEPGVNKWPLEYIRGYFRSSLEEATADLETGELKETTTSLSRYRGRLKLLDYLCASLARNAVGVEPWGTFINQVAERALDEKCTLVHTTPEQVRIAINAAQEEFRSPAERFSSLGELFGILYKEAVQSRPWQEELVESLTLGSTAPFNWGHRALTLAPYSEEVWDAVTYARDHADSPERIRLLAAALTSPAGPLGHAVAAREPPQERDWAEFLAGARALDLVCDSIFQAYPGTYARLLEGAPESVRFAFESIKRGVDDTRQRSPDPVVEKAARTTPRAPVTRLQKVAVTAAEDAREVALRVAVATARERLASHLTTWAEGRAPGSARSFIHSEAGRGLTTYLLGMGWRVAQEKYRGELAPGLGSDIAREIRLQGGEELVEGFYREVITPLLAHLSNPTAVVGRAVGVGSGSNTRIRFEEEPAPRAFTRGVEVTGGAALEEGPGAEPGARHAAGTVTPGPR